MLWLKSARILTNQVCHIIRDPAIHLSKALPPARRLKIHTRNVTTHNVNAGFNARKTISGYIQCRWNSRLVRAESNGTERMVVTKREDGQELKYPYLWLRDSCECAECFHPEKKGRQMLEIDINVTPTDVQLGTESDDIEVKWDDGHVSSFSSEWLWKRRFTESGRQERESRLFREPKLWGAELNDNLPFFDYNDVVHDDHALYEWLIALEDYGVAYLSNAPLELGALEVMEKRISFKRMTHFGPYYHVQSRPENVSSLGYTTNKLMFHIDLPHSPQPAVVQLLHCVMQAPGPGGDGQFADGFNIAEQMKVEYPDYYKLLCEVPLEMTDRGADVLGKFLKITTHKTINFDANGKMWLICISPLARDSFIRAPLDTIDPLLKAISKFQELGYHSKNLVQHKMKAGQIVCFSNNRLLHGRTAFQLKPGMERNLQGVYIDWEEFWSRRRLLEQDLGIKPPL